MGAKLHAGIADWTLDDAARRLPMADAHRAEVLASGLGREDETLREVWRDLSDDARALVARAYDRMRADQSARPAEEKRATGRSGPYQLAPRRTRLSSLTFDVPWRDATVTVSRTVIARGKHGEDIKEPYEITVAKHGHELGHGAFDPLEFRAVAPVVAFIAPALGCSEPAELRELAETVHRAAELL